MLVKLFFKQWQAKIKSLSPARRIFLSFALVILVGSLLLSLPFVQQASSKAGYIDHLFTAVSMVCVTGLFTQSVASTYNGLGQLICMLLIQIGGLGILTFIGLFFMEGRQKLSYKDRQTIRDSFSFSNNQLGPFCPLHLYYHLYHRRAGGPAPHDPLYPSLWLGAWDL